MRNHCANTLLQVWFMGTFAFLLGLPMLKSYVAFSAVGAAL